MSRSVGTTHPTRWDPPLDTAREPEAAVGTGLARSNDADIAVARQHRDRLVHAAVEVVTACGHDPDVAVCTDASCHLGPLVDGAAICRIAHQLARLPDAPAVVRPVSAAEAVAELRARLVAAADAIRHCRQSEHGAGSCWFTAAPGTDGCREVLRLLHRAC